LSILAKKDESNDLSRFISLRGSRQFFIGEEDEDDDSEIEGTAEGTVEGTAEGTVEGSAVTAASATEITTRGLIPQVYCVLLQGIH